MTKKPASTACGGVVLRGDADKQVLLVHRPKYDDWSLPKGKGKADELYPETALREIREETGIDAVLGLRLPSTRYQLLKGPKVCHFWRASEKASHDWEPNAEVDEVRWVKVSQAISLMSYADEITVLNAALAAPESRALMLVRHGKAMLRKNWHGPDHKRQLSRRGRDQAKALVDLLAAFDIRRLVTSSSVRCRETLAPYAKTAGIELELVDALTEEAAEKHPKRVVAYMRELKQDLTVPTAVCGHRPVLPDMFAGLGSQARPMVVGEGIAMHLDTSGEILKQDVFKPTA